MFQVERNNTLIQELRQKSRIITDRKRSKFSQKSQKQLFPIFALKTGPQICQAVPRSTWYSKYQTFSGNNLVRWACYTQYI